MRIFKRVLTILAILLTIPLIVAIFIPKKYTVSVKQTINKPQAQVFDYVKILNNQKYYSVWLLADPDLELTIVGQDGTLGAIQKWNSQVDDVGEGEQEIIGLTDTRIDLEIRFKRPFESKVKAANIIQPLTENTTEITSEFYSESPYPLNLPSYLFGKKIITDAQIKNLANLKKIVETN
ncbi:MAG: SRPBCC family protein [Bacteroidia bacterium]|nr:SRPBCC family protein [Bacteroidia bacterium]